MLRKQLKKLPKRLLLICLAIAMVLPLIACNSGSNSSSNTDSSSDSQTAEKKTFTVGFDANFPPYGYRDDNGEYVGFDLDLAQEVCNRRGWTLVKQPIDWDSKDMELSAKTIDCIWNGFTMSEERLDKYTWTEPYVDNSQVFVVAKDSGIKTFDDLAGKTVAVQTASSALEALDSDDCKELKASFKSLEQIPEYNTAFMNLEAKSVDAIAMDIGVAKYQIESRGDKFVMLSEPIITEKYGIAFLKGNETLRDEVQDTLYEMLKDGKLDEIAKKWELSDSVIFGSDTDAK
ncbi:MAG: amino acid ABC transporter substrate-binding protein [Acutalibacteraceae bacterium]